MAEWEGKSKGNRLGYQIFIALLKYTGVYPAYALLYFVVLYYYFFSTDTSRYILYFLRRRMGYGLVKSLFKLYRNYLLLGQTLIDRVIVSGGLGGKITSESFGAENLKAMVALKKGGILLGSHIGNWAIAAQYLMKYDSAINVLVYDREHAEIREYMDKVTGGRKFNVILIKDDISHVYAIGEALQRGEIICMTADRFMPGARAKAVNFIGEDAHFPIGPFQIIKTFKAPYTFVYGIKTGITHYNCYARPYREVTSHTTTDTIMLDYANDLGDMVKLHPEQWFNFYDFWKKSS